MKAFFDKESNLVAWLDDNEKNIFNITMEWVAFVSNSNIFSSKRMTWLGVYSELTFYDTEGRIIAWNTDSPMNGMSKPRVPYTPYRPYQPYTPYKPYTPYRPYVRLTPVNGWSESSFKDWLEM